MSATPDWLAQRGGVFRASAAGSSWMVLLEDKPLYRLTVVPVAGKYGCQITQTVNGQRIASAGSFGSPDEALRGGLDDLRKSLGW